MTKVNPAALLNLPPWEPPAEESASGVIVEELAEVRS
jgi:hypothetical protein